MPRTNMVRYPARRSTADASRRWAWLRLALALAVMLGAVLPHATLAATFHRAAPTSHGSHAASVTAKPCHGTETDADAPSAIAAFPSCCTLGCGMLAVSATIPPIESPAVWYSAAARPVGPLTGTDPEPDERPPREFS